MLELAGSFDAPDPIDTASLCESGRIVNDDGSVWSTNKKGIRNPDAFALKRAWQAHWMTEIEVTVSACFPSFSCTLPLILTFCPIMAETSCPSIR